MDFEMKMYFFNYKIYYKYKLNYKNIYSKNIYLRDTYSFPSSIKNANSNYNKLITDM